MTDSPPSELRVRQMRLIWRDTFVVPHAARDFLDESQHRLRDLPIYRSDSRIEPAQTQPEVLRVIERVSRGVAGIGYPNLLRVQFAPFEVANLRPTLDKHRRAPNNLTEQMIKDAGLDADYNTSWIRVTPMVLLHRAGIGIMQYHVTLYNRPGFTPDQAIERARMGFNWELLSIDDAWRAMLPDGANDWPVTQVVPVNPGRWLMAARLRDLSQGVIAARLGLPPSRKRRRRKEPMVEILPPRPTGSTSIVLVETDPTPGDDFAAFAAQYAPELRGIGSLDTDYQNRASWLVERELADNLSADSEMALYLLGSSELMLFNGRLAEAIAFNKRKLRLTDKETAVTYFFMHYGVLMEWVYLQNAILRAYLQQLDALAAEPSPHRRRMIAALQGALGDLVQYQEDITPYATRVEFLQRAHAYHKLDTLAERFERKQELLLNYVSEFHDYREARASEFLNWLAGILTGAALADLILALTGITPAETAAYLGITFGSIAVVLGIMWVLLRRV